MDLFDLLQQDNFLPKNEIIVNNFVKAYSIINRPQYQTIFCFISGGSDSDIMLDIVFKADVNRKVTYVWFDTGLEFAATKSHLTYLEKKYNINILKERAIKPIPVCTKEYGQPFISKNVSELLDRLQKKDFDFKDYDYNYMLDNYGKVLASWWCNKHESNQFNINRNLYLKEFLMANPPEFRISSKCCDYAKKNASKKLIKKYNVDLAILGVRKAEGGIRAVAYHNCFSEELHGAAQYRPLWWYSNQDKLDYEQHCGIKHSDCYHTYGFNRTGCCCCPYGWTHGGLQKELNQTKRYEPNLYKAVNNIFKDSFEYTKKYLKFRQDMKDKEKGRKRLF